MKKKILIALAIFLVLIQFVRIDKTNPELVIANDFIEINKPSTEIAGMLKSACYDCHSSESKYPWYSNVAPVSWLMKSHINGARDHFNFSEWNTYDAKEQAHILEECAEEIEKGKMPMKSYVFAHSEAKLSPEQKEALISYFESL
ncbi:MAG: heme-binding domain-containing protein [Chitinophagales bacterium]